MTEYLRVGKGIYSIVGPLRKSVFYGYIDRTVTGRSFYVGKGLAARVRYVSRNEKHQLISEAFGCIRTVEFVSESEAEVFVWEIETIDRLGTFTFNKMGCNLSAGGESGTTGYKHTEDTRARMSAARKGKPKSEEHRKNIGKAHKGREFSEEHKKRISLSAKDRPVRSTESRARTSASLTGQKRSDEALIIMRAGQQKRRQKERDTDTGYKHSSETKTKISNSLKKRGREERGEE